MFIPHSYSALQDCSPSFLVSISGLDPNCHCIYNLPILQGEKYYYCIPGILFVVHLIVYNPIGQYNVISVTHEGAQ